MIIVMPQTGSKEREAERRAQEMIDIEDRKAQKKVTRKTTILYSIVMIVYGCLTGREGTGEEEEPDEWCQKTCKQAKEVTRTICKSA